MKGLTRFGTALLLVLFILQQSTLAATNQFTVVNSEASAYVVNGGSNPDLTLVMGFTYTFQVTAPGHPFWIKSVQGTGTGNAYNAGVTGNGTTSGTLQFAVPTNAPLLLYYNCQHHSPMTGKLNIIDSPAISIIEFVTGPSLTLVSSGTDALNLSVESRSNIATGLWTSVNIIGNAFLGGTNTTEIAMPSSAEAFFRVNQGFQ
jgi:hypothetical protein